MKTKHSIFWKKGYLWITLIFFLGSLSLHWIFGWEAYKNEQEEKHLPVVFKDYRQEMLRDTMENWQSEFLQLIWQVVGLAAFLYVGSPSSKEGDERLEAKVDYILKKVEPQEYEALQKELNEKYPKK